MTVPLDRIATGTHLDTLETSMRRIQAELAQREQEISTGVRVKTASDDPLAAVRAMSHQASTERADQFLKNIGVASGEMASIDGSLGDLNDIATQARQILLGQMSDTATAETRQNAATEVQQLLEGAVAIANRKFGNRYLFGGNDALRAPVELVGNYAAFSAAARGAPEVNIGQGQSIQRGSSGADAFGALSAEILGRADLDPRLTASTKLADLNGGAGIRQGSIRVQDGLGGDVEVDLSSAETVGDVIDLIDASGIATAAINSAADGLALSAPGGDLTVTEVENGHAARDLGLLASAAGAGFDGGDLDPRLRLTTPLADLRGGLGIDPVGFTIQNGTYSVDISLAGMTTVEDFLNAVNGSGAYLTAALNRAGDGIDLRSTLSGARLTVTEGAGSTAHELGLKIDLAGTALEQLNGGLGVGKVRGDDLQITDRNGATFGVDIDGAVTVQDILDRINQDPDNPGTVTASAAAGQDRIVIQDSSGGSGTLSVASLNGSFTAENLGLGGPASGSTLTGEDLQPAGVQVDSLFNALIALRDGLSSNDPSKLSLVGGALDTSSSRLLDARADIGARMDRLDRTRSRLEDDKVELAKLLDQDRGADLAESVTEFQRQQTILQATYAVTGKILSLSLMDFLR